MELPDYVGAFKPLNEESNQWSVILIAHFVPSSSFSCSFGSCIVSTSQASTLCMPASLCGPDDIKTKQQV